MKEKVYLPSFESLSKHRDNILPDAHEIKNNAGQFVALHHNTDELVASHIDRLMTVMKNKGTELSEDDDYTIHVKVGVDGSNHPWHKVSMFSLTQK